MTARPPSRGTRRARAWSEAPIIRLFTFGQSRPLGLLVLLAVFATVALHPGWSPANTLRYWLFDSYQQVFPRVRSADAASAIVVAIDEDSLAQFGQWPWPHTLLARMLEQIGNANPKAIGIDLLLPDSDRQSVRLSSSSSDSRPQLRHQLAALPGSDAALAEVIARLPVVIAVAGLAEARAARTVVRSAPVLVQGGDFDPYVRHFTDALSSLDAIARTARGHGLINTDAPDGVVRRPLMVASVAGILLPSLSLDLLRVAAGADHFRLIIGRRGVHSMGYLDRQYPANADGTLWLHFGASDTSRVVSASQVLEGRIDASRFAGKIVLIGVTGLGLQDYQTTPLHTRMAGVEIHAQMVDNMVDGHFLRRPVAMLAIECVLLAVCSVALIVILPGWRPAASTGIFVAIVVVLVASGYLLFELQQLLLDAMLPALGTSLVFGVLITGNLANADSQRRQLRRQLKDQRAVTERMTGELEAARRIQLDMLPPPSSAAMGDPRFTLHALMAPARDVSGDLYDFFKLDADRL
ncbi:MAG: CHASE2 domain-containing protein, partial [Betaproteobacteria bacterium]